MSLLYHRNTLSVLSCHVGVLFTHSIFHCTSIFFFNLISSLRVQQGTAERERGVTSVCSPCMNKRFGNGILTYSKLGEDVGACSHAEADHAVDSVGKPPVITWSEKTNWCLCRLSLIIVSVCGGVYSLQLSHNGGQHLGQLIHGGILVARDG